MKRCWFYLTLALSIVSVWFLYNIVFKEQYLYEIALGWFLTLLNFIASTFIKFQTPKIDKKDSIAYILKWTIIKMVLLVTILAVIIFKKPIHLAPFLVAFLVNYWAWLIYEVLTLHFNSLGNNKSHEPAI